MERPLDPRALNRRVQIGPRSISRARLRLTLHLRDDFDISDRQGIGSHTVPPRSKPVDGDDSKADKETIDDERSGDRLDNAIEFGGVPRT